GDLAYVIEKMTGAAVPVVEVAGKAEVPDGPAIVLGELATAMGYGPQTQTPWRDMMRTVAMGGRNYIAGESSQATTCAVVDLLHEKGVRWFMPANIPGSPGEVIPQCPALIYADRDHERHPLLRSRRIWGHNVWTAESRYIR